MRPLYLMVGFWGERFRSDFLNYCLPSLLAPRNLGRLSAVEGHRFLVCTTATDWAALQEDPCWRMVAAHALPVHIEVGFPEDSSDAAKFKHMTLGHRLLARRVAKDRALGCQIFPDAMYSNGTIETALRYAAAGADAVLTIALRLTEEGLFDDLLARGLVPDRRFAARAPIVLEPRPAVEPALRNLYYDCMAHDWDSPEFPVWPSFCGWRLPGSTEMLFHSAYFAYILLNFEAISQHNERSFDIASIENFWLADNFPNPAQIHVVTDSDEAMIVSWTPAPRTPPVTRRRLVLRAPFLATFWKGLRLRTMREFHVIIGDIHKANNIRYPIRWHSGEFDARWAETEARARRIMLLFFGDVFPEFADKTPTWRLVPMKAWWFFVRRLAGLSARIYALKIWARR